MYGYYFDDVNRQQPNSGALREDSGTSHAKVRWIFMICLRNLEIVRKDFLMHQDRKRSATYLAGFVLAEIYRR